jgi:hypothetical protein
MIESAHNPDVQKRPRVECCFLFSSFHKSCELAAMMAAAIVKYGEK